MCLWGYSKGAIYSSAQDVDMLMKREGFDYQKGCFIRPIEREGDEITVRYGTSNGVEAGPVARAKTAILAAGTIGLTKLEI